MSVERTGYILHAAAPYGYPTTDHSCVMTHQVNIPDKHNVIHCKNELVIFNKEWSPCLFQTS